MDRATVRPILLGVWLVLALGGCGGGGSPEDVRPGPQPPDSAAGEPDKFLLFPNPQQQPDGSLQTNTQEYAEAYYRAIDPNAERDTLDKFKAKNGFGTSAGTEVSVVFGDRRDLGYGRRMYGRQNADGTIAFYVESYLVQAGDAYGYTPLNLDAAIVRDAQWLLAVNAIEFSPGPQGGVSFAKFYSYNPAGARQLSVNMDTRGAKAMPGPCIACHGGRGDALTAADASGKRLFNLVQNGVAHARGDAQAKLQPLEPDVFDYSTTRAGFSRQEQEASIKALNKMVLCSYPLAKASTFPEDACRRAAGRSEWQGTPAALIKAGYGGDGLPNPTFVDDFVPAAWEQAGQGTLYTQVVAPSCRTCHSVLGTAAQSDIDFSTYAKFVGHAGRIKAHVLDRGNMPLAKIVYDAFWGDPQRAALVATFLEGQGLTARDSTGAVLRPGRPVADAGPDRVAKPGAITISGEGSLFADAYAWSIVSGPAGSALAGASTATPALNATTAGTYVLQLIVSNGQGQGAPAQVRVAVDPTLSPAPADIRFANVKAVLQASGSCTACHSPTGFEPRPPVFFTSEDRNGDGVAGDAVDDRWFYEEVRGLVNFTDIAASQLLRKPSGNHHAGGRLTGFDASKAPGAPERARYDVVLNWILNGAPF